MKNKLADGVTWVGFVDWNVRDFHGYVTSRGSTYNAYLIEDEKNAVIDTVKVQYVDDFLARVAAQIPLDKVDYIICNHAEPDHSGGFPAALKACPNAVVVCNAKCQEILARHFDVSDWKFLVVKEGDTLSLGSKTLQFFDTPMVHWPESMVTYYVEEEILFSMDAFGQHYATSHRFDDEADMCEVMQEAKIYYANIVLPFERPVDKALEKLGGLKIRMIATSHGVIWRSHIAEIMTAYQGWRVSKPAKKVVIAFTSMWNSTRNMAKAIAEGAEEYDVDVHLLDMADNNNTTFVTEIMDAAAVAFGSATLNMGIMPRMASALTYLRGLKPKGKTGVAFGAYGWAAKGSEEVAGYMQAMGMEFVCAPIVCQFSADAATLAECREAGRALARVALQAD
ncbi:MAG: FprA family A-type flavoprotein [Kiritimatiellia bacterium]